MGELLYCEPLTKAPPTRLGVRLQQLIDDSVEVHEPSVLSEVVFGFPEEHVHLTVTPSDCDLPGFGK